MNIMIAIIGLLISGGSLLIWQKNQQIKHFKAWGDKGKAIEQEVKLKFPIVYQKLKSKSIRVK